MSLSKELFERQDQKANEDAHSMDDVDGVNDVDAEETHHALRLSLILQKILSNLGLDDLLRCSFVNNQWNYEAKSALKKLKKDYCGYHWFHIVEDNLDQLSYHPGMSIIPATTVDSSDIMGRHTECNYCVRAQNVNAFRMRSCRRHLRRISDYDCERQNCPGYPYLNFFYPLGIFFYLEPNFNAPKIRRKRFKTNFIAKCKANYIVPARRNRRWLYGK